MKNEKLFSALSEIDAEFNKEALDWLIGMYDGESGGFYYSRSSIDNSEFQPDIESTTQATSLMCTLGLFDSNESGNSTLPEWYKEGVYSFLTSRQDKDDGYYYDPVYRSCKKDKKERNTDFATTCLRCYIGKPALYPTPMERLSSDSAKESTENSDQTMYATKESYIAWLDDISKNRPNSYYWGSDIASGYMMICATGHKMDTAEWLRDHQCKENGTWESDFGMTAVNGVLKIAAYFGKDTFAYPNYDIFIKNVVEFTKTFKPTTAAENWNAMASLQRVLRSVGDDLSPELRRIVDDGVVEMIKTTVKNMRTFRQPDGGFGYLTKGSSPTSNSVVVSLGLPEGDVNALALMASTFNTTYTVAAVPRPKIWEGYRDYFWAEMKKKREKFVKI